MRCARKHSHEREHTAESSKRWRKDGNFKANVIFANKDLYQ